MRSAAVGLGLAVTSAATFGTAGSFGDTLLESGWTPGGAVTVRVGLAALVLTVPAVLSLRGKWHLLRHNLMAAFAYGVVAVAGCQLFFFNAIEHLSVGVALLLEYCGTLLVVVWMWLRHGQRPQRLTVIGGAIALIGLVLVLDLTGPQHVDLVGVLWGLGAAAGLATYFVLSSAGGSMSAHAKSGEPSKPSMPPIAMAWAGMTFGALALVVLAALGAIPFRVRTSDVDFAGHRTSWLVPVLGVSLVAAVLAYTTGIAAARRLGARVASFVGLAEVLFAILFAWLLLDQTPSTLQLVGGVVVLAGIALVRMDDRETAIVPAEPPIPLPA